MSEPTSATTADASDDLPRTLRREREARYREVMDRVSRETSPAGPVPSAGPSPTFGAPDGGNAHAHLAAMDLDDGRGVTVTALQVPFMRLVLFFLKAALAAIPA
ncbi:MAG TPA: hypothetical protein PK264_11465, partial [Hyphomicrobiaceae bacterium]|nr:hypothetical protein [Hyphomicrobiaceae bacterium]